jgi:5'-3' exonuclease
MLHVSRKLAEIHCEVPLPLSIENAGWSHVSDSSISFIEELELKVLRRFLLSAESLIASS